MATPTTETIAPQTVLWKPAGAAMASSKYDSEIQSNIALAQKLQATGTPTFVIGDQVLSGAVGYDALKEGVATARGK